MGPDSIDVRFASHMLGEFSLQHINSHLLIGVHIPQHVLQHP